MKELGTIGDVNAPEYDGGWVFEDDGRIWIEWVDTPTGDDMSGGSYKDSARWTVYRVHIETPEVPSWADLDDVASSTGGSASRLRKDFLSRDPMRRALAYWDLAGYHGWHELDNYPLVLTKKEIEKRYGAEITG
jgi:hypothetical protein